MSLLRRLGVDDNELSPFCKEIESPAELLAMFNDYTPANSSSDDTVVEGGEDEGGTTATNETRLGRTCDPQTLKTAIDAAMDSADTADTDVTEVDLSQDVNADILLEDDDNRPPVLRDLKAVLAASVDELADAACTATAKMEIKKTDSVTMDRKHKSLQGRWFASKPKEGGSVENPEE